MESIQFSLSLFFVKADRLSVCCGLAENPDAGYVVCKSDIRCKLQATSDPQREGV